MENGLIARQRFDYNLPAANNTPTTITELMNAVFSVQSDPNSGKESSMRSKGPGANSRC
jgi:hypothetical protein